MRQTKEEGAGRPWQGPGYGRNIKINDEVNIEIADDYNRLIIEDSETIDNDIESEVDFNVMKLNSF